MLLVKLWALTHKPTAQPWRCNSYDTNGNSAFGWQEDYTAFLQSKGVNTKLQNTKYDKLKDALENAEKLVTPSNSVSRILWKGNSKQELQVLLKTGTVITYNLDEFTGSVSKVGIEDFLEDFIPSPISSATWGSSFISLGLENRQLAFIQPKKTQYLYEAKKHSDLLVNAYGDTTDVVSDIVLNEDHRLLLSNTGTKFTVYTMVNEKKSVVLLEADKYQPAKSNKMRIVKFSVLHADVIYGIEEKHRDYLELQVFMFTKRKLTVRNTVKLTHVKNNDIHLKCADLSPDESLWSLGFSDGSIIIYNLTTGGDKVANPFAKGSVSVMKWNKTSSVLLVCYREGVVLFLDRSMQPIDLLFDDGNSAMSIEASAVLGRKVRIHDATWASSGTSGIGPFAPSSSLKGSKADTRPKSYECAFDNIAIALDGGPAMVIRLELGAFNKGKLTNSVIINMRLSNLQIQEVLEVLLSLSSNTEFYLCFSKVVDFLLRADSFEPYDYLELLFEKCWNVFFDQTSKFVEPARNLYIRYVNYLIREKKYEAAFKAATQIDIPELFMQLRMCCKNEPIIYEASTLRLQNAYNINNALKVDLLQRIMDDGNGIDGVIEQGLQLESQGKLSSARALYVENGKTEEELRVNFISQYVKDVE